MIQHGFIISLTVLFIHACCWEWMIFGFIHKVVPTTWKISKPIYNCPICMTPWYGTIIFLIFFGHMPFIQGLKEWFLTIGTASGLSVLWVCLLSLKDAANIFEQNNLVD